MWLARALCLALGIAAARAAGPASARADLQPLDDGRARIGVGSWRDLGHPERREARLLQRQGVALLLLAASSADDGLEPPSQVRVEQALARFDRALAALGDDPELAFYRGIALSRFVREEAGGRALRRTEDAIAELGRVRALDPSYEPVAVAWHLALLHTRVESFAAARGEYERVRAGQRLAATPMAPPSAREEALYILFTPPEPGVVELNLAEVTMLDGDPQRARRLYDGVVEAAERGSHLAALGLFGRALAEERVGAHAEALASALAATRVWTPSSADPELVELVARHGPVAALHVPGVGFDPRWEIHAYEALAHEALAREATTAAARGRGAPEAADGARERARRSLRAFFAVGGERSRYREVAERALQRLE